MLTVETARELQILGITGGKSVELQDGRRRVLVVDDEAAMRDSCQQVLEREGYIVDTAVDGAQSLECARTNEPDVAILDLKMPGISDIELVSVFKERNPGVVPVVVTGYATLNSAVEAMKAGAYDFLPKPFTPDELRVVVRRAIEKRELERKSGALEQEKRLMQDNFAAMVSHQLKSPLAAAAECLEAVRIGAMGALSDKQQSMLERASTRIDELLDVIEDWLKLSRIEMGQGEQDMGPVDVCTVIHDAWNGSTDEHDRERVTFNLEVERDPGPVYGNEGLLSELLGNLFTNALKYVADTGSVSVTVRPEGSDAVIAVSDTGIGIPEEELPYVFDTFFRGSGEHAKSVGGTGLGLAIVKSIVEAHGGLIRVESVAGKGTTFSVRLPKEKRSGG